MSEPPSADYQSKRREILQQAARIFAEHDSADVSLDRLSVAMGKSHNYHCRYFPTKAELVYALLDTHLTALLEAAGEAEALAGPGRARLDAMAFACLDHILGEGADAQRIFTLVLRRVTREQRQDVRTKLRWLAALFADALAEALPGLAARPELAAPLTRSLFAMLGGAPQWFRTDGALSGAQYARLAVSCTLEGARAELQLPR